MSCQAPPKQNCPKQNQPGVRDRDGVICRQCDVFVLVFRCRSDGADRCTAAICTASGTARCEVLQCNRRFAFPGGWKHTLSAMLARFGERDLRLPPELDAYMDTYTIEVPGIPMDF